MLLKECLISLKPTYISLKEKGVEVFLRNNNFAKKQDNLYLIKFSQQKIQNNHVSIPRHFKRSSVSALNNKEFKSPL